MSYAVKPFNPILRTHYLCTYTPSAMYEAVIRYDNPKVLDVLRGISAFFGFTVATTEEVKMKVATASDEKENFIEINGHKVLKGTGHADGREMASIFSRLDLDAGQLRRETWQRRQNG